MKNMKIPADQVMSSIKHRASVCVCACIFFCRLPSWSSSSLFIGELIWLGLLLIRSFRKQQTSHTIRLGHERMMPMMDGRVWEIWHDFASAQQAHWHFPGKIYQLSKFFWRTNHKYQSVIQSFFPPHSFMDDFEAIDDSGQATYQWGHTALKTIGFDATIWRRNRTGF